MANWQTATDINFDHQGPKTEFLMGFIRHHSFLYTLPNNCTNKQLRTFWYVIDIPNDKYLNVFEKLYLWPLMITFNMSVAICQISIRNFVHFEISRLITVEKVYQHILQISLKVGLIESERFAAFRKHQEGL